MRLIDADALVSALDKVFAETCYGKDDRRSMRKALTIGFAETVAKRMPTIDAVPVKQGTWILMSDSVGKYSCCSWCGHEGFKGMNYCPICGAKMDGERKDDE